MERLVFSYCAFVDNNKFVVFIQFNLFQFQVVSNQLNHNLNFDNLNRACALDDDDDVV